jgi:hypothetical protein
MRLIYLKFMRFRVFNINHSIFSLYSYFTVSFFLTNLRNVEINFLKSEIKLWPLPFIVRFSFGFVPLQNQILKCKNCFLRTWCEHYDWAFRWTKKKTFEETFKSQRVKKNSLCMIVENNFYDYSFRTLL